VIYYKYRLGNIKLVTKRGHWKQAIFEMSVLNLISMGRLFCSPYMQVQDNILAHGYGCRYPLENINIGRPKYR